MELFKYLNNSILYNKMLNIVSSNNIKLEPNKLKKETHINTEKKIYYLNRVDNYIYYKYIDDNILEPENNIVSKIDILNPLIPNFNDDFIVQKGCAGNNMYFFKDINDNIKIIGGQHLGKSNYDIFKKNIIYDNYNSTIDFLDSSNYLIKMPGYRQIYNPLKECPYYANGLHLFTYKDNIITCENNNLPILSGIKEGRYDGHYGNTDNNSLSSCRNGLSVYDSLTSVVYNYTDSTYYLYQRANIGTGIRSIQYSTSKNLYNWSEFNIVNFKDNPFMYNIYYSNFFKFKNIYLAILPYVKRINNSYNSVDKYEYYNLYYSHDCINYILIGPIHVNILNEGILEQYFLCTNEPVFHNDKLYFYIQNNLTKQLGIFYIEKNRYFYITNDSDNEANIVLIYEKKDKLHLKLNICVEYNGYIKMQLTDKNNNVIDNYSYDNFDIICNIDEINYTPSWNKISNTLPDTSYFINIIFYNAKIYEIIY